jgi:SSS family solute:Na+ symporter
LYGIGTGGLLEGEPRARLDAFLNYFCWIIQRRMEAVAQVKPAGHGYVIEWKVCANPCLEVKPGVYWSPALGSTKMGLNIALGDLDEKPRGEGNFGHFHHEDWWAGEQNKRTWLKQYGTIILEPGPR